MVICLYLLAREQTGSNLYRSALRTAAVAVMVLGMLTKECSVVVPLLVLLLEWLVMGSSLRDSLRSCWHLLLTLPIIPALVLLTSAAQSGGGLDVTAGLNIVNSRDVPFQHLDYLLTQTTVVAHYLRLVLWPSGLNLDPEWPLHTSLFAPPVLLAVMTHVGLATVAVLCWRRWAGDFRAGLCLLGVLWFYLAISVSSGLVPLPDLVAEHRSYLASAGFILALVSGFDLLFEAYEVKRTALALSLVAGVSLASVTVQRNRDWSSEVSLWSDTVEKSPGKYRPWNNLGAAYSERREELRALECFQRAQALEPRFAMSALNTSNSLLRLKRPTEALESLDSLLDVNQAVADDFAVRYTPGIGT